ncbi:hypothetical protein [Anaerotruncus massiliensis (ex Togo et al. 2019)]|uniref:hypothetical protein n=1 Tax=Anaerotruncus TaxID=244127 RepID=UPI001556C3AC|nr:hypothetical protein [Anaerotruncus massiliensis (ex Togo et al. 2019)]
MSPLDIFPAISRAELSAHQTQSFSIAKKAGAKVKAPAKKAEKSILFEGELVHGFLRVSGLVVFIIIELHNLSRHFLKFFTAARPTGTQKRPRRGAPGPLGCGVSRD